MSCLSAILCQRVPAFLFVPRREGVRRSSALLALLALLGCDQPGARRLALERQAAPVPAPQQEAPRTLTDLHPTRPPQCPALGCEPQRFEVLFERARQWTAGTYYLRASVDGGPRQVCSVVFEPVLGAAHDTCDDAALPFRVHYRYDESEQSLSGVSFGQVHAVELTVLTSEETAPLVHVEHQLTFQYASGSAGCGPCPASPAALSVRVSEPSEQADAGSRDAGAPPADGGALSDGGVPADGGSSAGASGSALE